MASIEISEECAALIFEKAAIYRVTPEEILEAMIGEFFDSEQHDVSKNIDRKYQSYAEFISKYPDATVEKAWRKGYSKGWLDYQLRHTRTFINTLRRHQRNG